MLGVKINFDSIVLAIFYRATEPLLIGEVLMYFNPESFKKISTKVAYMYTFGLILNLFTAMSLRYFAQTEALNCGMKMRVACCSVIYRKVCKLCKYTGNYIWAALLFYFHLFTYLVRFKMRHGNIWIKSTRNDICDQLFYFTTRSETTAMCW